MSETQNIEYKQSWRDDYLKWICGFANANGGSIFIGKDDNGNVVGLTDTKRLLQEIPNKVRDVLGILVDVNLHSTTDGEFLEIIVEGYPYPVNYKGQYHYRSGSTKQELKGSSLDKFLLQKKGKRWDSVPVPKVTAKDLKQETFDFFRKRAFKSQRIEQDILTDSNEHLLENLQLKENKFLKRAAILLFHSNPENFVTGSYIKIGFFETDDDLKFQDEIHGNLLDQIDVKLSSCENILNTSTTTLNNTSLTVFPNPVNDFIHIRNNQVLLENENVDIMDYTGKIILSSRLNSEGGISIKLLNNGLYFLKQNLA